MARTAAMTRTHATTRAGGAGAAWRAWAHRGILTRGRRKAASASASSASSAPAPPPSSAAASASRVRVARDAVASGASKCEDLVRKCLNRIDEVEPRVRSFVPGVAMAESRKQALHRAAALDARLAEEGDASSSSGELPLAGVTLAIKDNMCTAGIPTTAGSRALAGYVPPHDATVVRRLLDAGATVVGKTMCDEFGMGSTTESCYVQGSDDDLATGDGSLPPPGPTTRNPWDLTRVPGGSSGGSAAAVASGCCDAALGTDTGGSVRQPAAFCGVVGLKPTYGLCSRWGLIAYASSLDVPGPIAATVEDCALLLDVIAGPDARDASAAPSPSPSAGTGWAGGSGAASYAGAVDAAQALLDSPGAGGALAGLRVGVVSQTMDAGSGGVDPGVHATVEAALDRLKGAGAQVGPANLPSFGLGLPAYYVTAVAEASSNLSRYDGLRYANAGASASGFGGADLMAAIADHRGRGLGGEPLRRVLMGTYALSEGYGASLYKRAQAVRKRVQGEMLGALDDFDVLVTPTAPTLAYASDAKDLLDPLQMYLGDVMTVNVNLAGFPAVSVPAGLSEGLPVGMQLIAAPFQEAKLLAAAHILQVLSGNVLEELEL